MITIYFTKYFTKGILKGLSYIDSVSFVSSQTDSWVAWINEHKVKPVTNGKTSYIITDFSFQNYKR